MTQLVTLTFVAAIALWGLASIPDGSGSDKASPANRRVELARASNRVFVTSMRRNTMSAVPARNADDTLALR
jgi:hypothetical protein